MVTHFQIKIWGKFLNLHWQAILCSPVIMNFDFYSQHGSLLTIIGLEVDETSVIIFVIRGPKGLSLEEKNELSMTEKVKWWPK